MAEHIEAVPYSGAIAPPVATPPGQKTQAAPEESAAHAFVPEHVPESSASPEEEQGRVINQMV